MDVGKVAAPDGMVNDSRREALKRFARYAAAAPTTMVLLQPSESYAGPKKAAKKAAKKQPKRRKKAAGTSNLGNLPCFI